MIGIKYTINGRDIMADEKLVAVYENKVSHLTTGTIEGWFSILEIDTKNNTDEHLTKALNDAIKYELDVMAEIPSVIKKAEEEGFFGD